MPWCVLPWVQLLWDLLSILDFLEVYFLCQIGEEFSFIMFSNSYSSSSPSGTPMSQMLKYLKLSWRFLCLSSFFWILVFSFCSGWMFISSFWSKPLLWVLVSFPSLLVLCTFYFTVGSLYIFLYLTFYSLHFFPYFLSILNHFCEHPDNQCFELCILIGWLSLHHLVVLFLQLWSILLFGPIFFCLGTPVL